LLAKRLNDDTGNLAYRHARSAGAVAAIGIKVPADNS